MKSPGDPKSGQIQSLLNAAPDFSLGLLYLFTWFFPLALERKMVSHLLLVLIMEFIIIHSSVFIGINMISGVAPRKKAVRLIGIGLFYTIFVAGFSYAFGVWWPFFAFWGLMGNRLLSVFLKQAPTGEERALIMKSWVVGIVCYLFSAAFSGIVPLPSLGLDAHVIALQELNASGSWIEEPETAMAFGFLYFTLVGLYEVRARSLFQLPGNLFNEWASRWSRRKG